MKRLNAKREAIRNQNLIEEQKHISDRADRNAKQKESVQKYFLNLLHLSIDREFEFLN